MRLEMIFHKDTCSNTARQAPVATTTKETACIFCTAANSLCTAPTTVGSEEASFVSSALVGLFSSRHFEKQMLRRKHRTSSTDTAAHTVNKRWWWRIAVSVVAHQSMAIGGISRRATAHVSCRRYYCTLQERQALKAQFGTFRRHLLHKHHNN